MMKLHNENFRCWFLSLAVLNISLPPVFGFTVVNPPGFQRVHEGSVARVQWEVREPSSATTIIRGPGGHKVATFAFLSMSSDYSYWGYKPIGNDATEFGFVIENATARLHAGRYTLEQGGHSNSDCVLFVYRQLRRPTIRPLKNNTLECVSISTSKPRRYRPQILYTWQVYATNNTQAKIATFQSNNSKFKVSDTGIEANIEGISCIASEHGSKFTSVSEWQLVDIVSDILSGSTSAGNSTYEYVNISKKQNHTGVFGVNSNSTYLYSTEETLLVSDQTDLNISSINTRTQDKFVMVVLYVGGPLVIVLFLLLTGMIIGLSCGKSKCLTLQKPEIKDIVAAIEKEPQVNDIYLHGHFQQVDTEQRICRRLHVDNNYHNSGSRVESSIYAEIRESNIYEKISINSDGSYETPYQHIINTGRTGTSEIQSAEYVNVNTHI